MTDLAGFETRRPSGDFARAQRRLDRWRQQPPFDVAGYFEERLSLENLYEEGAPFPLSRGRNAARSRLAPLTPWFDEIEEIYRAYPAPLSGAAEARAGPPRPIEGFAAILDPLAFGGPNAAARSSPRSRGRSSFFPLTPKMGCSFLPISATNCGRR